MEKLAEIWFDHNRGICNLRAKFPALHVFMFHAGCSRAHHGRGNCWLSFISAHKQNMKRGRLDPTPPPATTPLRERFFCNFHINQF